MRKELKKIAKSRLKKCYGLFMVLCLFMALIGLDYQNDLTLLKYQASSLSTVSASSDTGSESVTDADAPASAAEEASDTEESTSMLRSILATILAGDEQAGEQASDAAFNKKAKQETHLGPISLGYTGGILSGIVNNVSSGRILSTAFKALRSITHSRTAARVIFIILTLLFAGFVWVFVFNLLWVTIKRIFMESRLYDHVPIKRFLFYIENGRALNVVWTILLCDIYSFLWSLTIVGGCIKYYSYRLVPYIVAENPAIGAREAITLSRKMMDGHKWEAFILDLSFILWKLLNLATFGLLGIFFLNPYIEATDAEYYAYLRVCAREKLIPGSEKLNDIYLYERAPQEILDTAYSDVRDYVVTDTYEPRKGVRGWIENIFGITLVADEKEKEYERIHGEAYNMRSFKAILDGNMYPRRLFTIAGEDVKFKKLSSLNFDRRYSILSLIFIFFAVCIVGWLWEGSLHVIIEGRFPNRGVLHGPWLPIYGGGSVLILIFLNKLRTHPLAEFCSAVALCGFVEYFTSYYLEISKDGAKWWDYTGYFLNINGRVCAEGLLIFGLGGIAIVYFLAPFLDNMFRYIPLKAAVPVAAVLVLCFTGDLIYSGKHPNQGAGITDYNTAAQWEETDRIELAADPVPLDLAAVRETWQSDDFCMYEIID